MKSSTSPLKGIILDTNVLSRLAKENALDLLEKLPSLPLYVTTAIQDELDVGLKNGVSYLSEVLLLIDRGVVLLATVEGVERKFMRRLPRKLAKGEAEAIVICRQRSMVFITHDRKAAEYCERAKIACIRLTDWLIVLQDAGILTPTETKRILS